MKIISWNVNSIRIRKHQLLELIKKENPDFVCLQEIKSSNDAFPIRDFEKLNYFSYINGMPSYNGVGILSKYKADSTYSHVFCNKNDSRHIEVKYKGLRIHFSKYDAHILPGDLNIAPYENDVWSHKQLRNVVSHTEIERTKLLDILESGNFIDALKKLIPSSENLFTWWSYRSPDFRLNNRGRRLDHIWINKKSSLKLIKAKIIKEYRELQKPSDHVPVVLELSL